MSELPPGFMLDQSAAPASSTAELPPGFVLDQPNASAPDQRSALDRLLGVGGERYQLWPEKLARAVGEQALNAITTPGRAYQQGLTPEEEIKGATDIASTFAMPAIVGTKIPIPTLPGKTAAELSPHFVAAQTAADAGASLPYGLTGGRAMQAVTQAARQLPVVGQKIDEQLARATTGAGENIQQLAGELAGGVTDRASSGALLRPALQGVIENNNGRIDDAFSALRGMLDQSEPMEIPRTEAVLKAIIKERTGAGEEPLAGLGNVQRLVDQGATFDNLQRARSTIANSIDYGAANPGFNTGDLKRLAIAMKSDMDTVARQSARPGISPDTISQALANANTTAQPIFDANKQVQRLLGAQSNERMVGSIIGAAQGKTGNVQLLAQLRNTMDPEDFAQISGTALNELGHNAATNQFSLSQFTTQWDKLGDRAKSVLFTPEHRANLNNIAKLGGFLKGTEKYANVSGTGRAVTLTSIIGGLGYALAHLAHGDPWPLLSEITALGGGYALGSFLGRPAGAAAMARWARALEAYRSQPSPARVATLNVITRDLVRNLADTTTTPTAGADTGQGRLRVTVPVPFGR